jgi:Holliday junction resolvase
MKTYAKGARNERELLHFLNYKGFSCVRAASSGGHLTPVDIVAMKNGRVLCLEIKAWAKKPKLERKKLERFKNWCENAGAMGFLAWRARNEWLFLPLKDAENNRYEDENWIAMENFMNVMMIE